MLTVDEGRDIWRRGVNRWEEKGWRGEKSKQTGSWTLTAKIGAKRLRCFNKNIDTYFTILGQLAQYF